MAKTWGYGVKAFTGGFQTGLSMRMERDKIDALKDEQKRLEKAQKEAERVFQEWYDSPETKEFCANLDTASQGQRAYFITGISRIREDVFKYFTEIDNDIREGNIAEAKSKNDLLEAKLKAAVDLAEIGMTAVFPDGSPMKISPEDIEFQKKIQIGKVAGGKTGEAIGREMWRGRGFGELPKTLKEPDLLGAITYLKKFPNPTPEQFNSLKTGVEKYFNVDLANVTQESLWAPEAPTTPPVPTTIENIREDITTVDTVEDARRIYKNYVNKYGTEGLDIPEGDVDKFWGEGQMPYLDKIKTSIGNILDEKGWLKKGTLTSAEVGLDFKGDQPVEEIYKMLRVEYMKYREMLEELGIDVSQFPKIKTLEEIEKVGLGEGFWGWGKQKGQYKSIYY